MGKYGINGIPHAFVVKDGTVVWNGHPMDKLEAAIDDALK
jgi:protein-disulfide isomerase